MERATLLCNGTNKDPHQSRSYTMSTTGQLLAWGSVLRWLGGATEGLPVLWREKLFQSPDTYSLGVLFSWVWTHSPYRKYQLFAGRGIDKVTREYGKGEMLSYYELNFLEINTSVFPKKWQFGTDSQSTSFSNYCPTIWAMDVLLGTHRSQEKAGQPYYSLLLQFYILCLQWKVILFHYIF